MSAKYDVKRSRMHVRKVGTSVLRDVNTVDSATYSFEENKITKQSTNEVIGDVASKTISTTGTLTAVFGSTEWENFVLTVRAKVSTQGATANGAFIYPVLAVGQAIKLGHVNVSAVAIPGKTEGVDYQVLGTSGLVVALQDNAAEVEGCTYAAGVAKRGAIAAGSDGEYEVIFTDVLNGEVTQFYRWQPNLPQNIALISPNEWGVYEVSGTLLLDTSKPADGELGQFGVKYEVQAV